MKNSEVIQRTLDAFKFERVGWMQGDLLFNAHTYDGAFACLVGGLILTQYKSDINARGVSPKTYESILYLPCTTTIAEVIHAEYPERVGLLQAEWSEHAIATIERFNDHFDTRWDDIERVLEKAYAKELEQELLANVGDVAGF